MIKHKFKVHSFGFLVLYGIEKTNVPGSINKYVLFGILKMCTMKQHIPIKNYEMVYSSNLLLWYKIPLNIR